MMRFRRESGDTLIEVLIAITILSLVLMSLYGLLNDAFKLSLIARERSQATQYLQWQSEGLRALRDSMEWSEFTDRIDGTSNPFYVARDTATNRWVIRNNTTTYDNRFTVGITDETSAGTSNSKSFRVNVEWEKFGGGRTETTTAEFELTNLQFDEFPQGTSSGPIGPTPSFEGTGVCGYYYAEQTENSDPPPDFNFEGDPYVRLDETIDFDWGNSGAPASEISSDNFSVRWRGEIEIPTTGNYTFYTRSDDGIRLRIGGTTVIEEWYRHAPTVHSNNISLSAGKHSLVMEMYEHTGYAVAELDWESSAAGINKQTVPKYALYPDPSNSNCSGPPPATHMIGATAFSDGGDNRPVSRTASDATLQLNESGGNMKVFPWGGSYPDSRATITWSGTTVEFNQIRIRAKGEYYNGWPNIQVFIDGNKAYDRGVNTSTYGIITRNIGNRNSGRHTIAINFPNDACCGSNGEDRNLYLDYVELRKR